MVKQVICITHLPQIAAMADQHYLIEKREQDGRTRTTVQLLDSDGRQREIARLYGGDQITPLAKLGAEALRHLLGHGRGSRLIGGESERHQKTMTLYDELIARGLIAQVTNEEEIKNMINNGKATFYIGFDCTADSLHVGHFMALCLMKRLQMAGNKPIALIGDGTTLIGDPSGRTDMRRCLLRRPSNTMPSASSVRWRLRDFSDGKALMLYNSEWLKPLNYIELLREVGACFSVNNMLRAECYKQRMEKGLSFLEFNYMIMQSYDFYYMFQHYGCNMQFGGNDQWSNMLGGTELIRRKLGKDAHAMTITLLLNSEGKKMGKTAKGAVWLDPNKTTPFEFYQYWRNVDDADVLKCIRMLTFLPLEEIDKMDSWQGEQLNKAKETGHDQSVGYLVTSAASCGNSSCRV